MRANATARENVVAILNSMTLHPLPLSLISSNLQVMRLTSSISSGAIADVSKDTSMATRNASVAASIEDLQPSSDAPRFVICDAAIVQADSPPQESPEPKEEAREPMQVDGDASREEGRLASASTIDKGKDILIENSESNDENQVAPMDAPADEGETPNLDPTDMYTTTKA